MILKKRFHSRSTDCGTIRYQPFKLGLSKGGWFLKNMKQLLKKAQAVFNKWIRERDRERGCISCQTGRPQNAGHYYHAHLYSAIRFNEINVQGQCIHCNLSKAGAAERFREGLIRRYGEQKILLLDSAARAKKKWTKTELEQIIKTYS